MFSCCPLIWSAPLRARKNFRGNFENIILSKIKQNKNGQSPTESGSISRRRMFRAHVVLGESMVLSFCHSALHFSMVLLFDTMEGGLRWRHSHTRKTKTSPQNVLKTKTRENEKRLFDVCACVLRMYPYYRFIHIIYYIHYIHIYIPIWIVLRATDAIVKCRGFSIHCQVHDCLIGE